MEKQNKLKIWLAQFRANFLVLAVLLVLIGLALAMKSDIPHPANLNTLNIILLFIGGILSHSSVNLFNEYSDFKTKIDFDTEHTPFSGGTGLLPGGVTKPGSVLAAALITFFISAAIGVYFMFNSHWSLLLLVIIGAFSIIFYTTVLAKMMLGELFAGFALGTLLIIGTYVALVGTPEMLLSELYTGKIILISIPSGILTSLLLLLNEFPDAESDKKGGRLHLVIKFGWKGASYIYTASMVILYGIIVILPLLNLASFWIYISLLTIPLAFRTSMTAIKFGDKMDKIVPALGINVIIVLATDLLIAISIFIS
jgi:1,4-dihydroxy-2-naphthoate polyprenyltransferase